jgi:hypothetical protein
MTADQLEARRKVYQEQLAVAQHQAQEALQRIGQLQGAIADCAYWLEELAKTGTIARVSGADSDTMKP